MDVKSSPELAVEKGCFGEFGFSSIEDLRIGWHLGKQTPVATVDAYLPKAERYRGDRSPEISAGLSMMLVTSHPKAKRRGLYEIAEDV